MPSKCNVVGSDGKKCTNQPLSKKSVYLSLKVCCQVCIPNVGNSLVPHETNENFVRLTNPLHDDGIIDLSQYQNVVQSIIRRLQDSGITVEDEYVESYLLEFLKTRHWDANIASFQRNKKRVAYIFYVKGAFNHSLIELVAGLILIASKHGEKKQKDREDIRERREAGVGNEICRSCFGPETSRHHAVGWARPQLQKKYQFNCADCLKDSLLKLEKTNRSLLYIDVGEGIFLFTNQLHDPTSDDKILGVETFCLDFNHPKTPKPVVFHLIGAGVVVPPAHDTVKVKAFLEAAEHLEEDHAQQLLRQRNSREENRLSLEARELAVFNELNGKLPAFTKEVINQETDKLGTLTDSILAKFPNSATILGMANACSVDSEIKDGVLSTTRWDKEHLRKIDSTEAAILLTRTGSKLTVDQDYTVVTVSDASELDQVQVGTSPKKPKIQVIVYNVGGPAEHPAIRKMEEAAIAKIQEKAKSYSRLISTEGAVYRPGGISSKRYLGQTTSVFIVNCVPLIMNGDIFFNANMPPFLKRDIIRCLPDLQPSNWKFAGDKLDFGQRLSMLLPSPSQQQQNQIIVAQPTRSQGRNALKKRDMNARVEESKDEDHHEDKKQRAIPEEVLRKSHIVISGSVGDRDVLNSKLKANKSWLNLTLCSEFPDDIHDQARNYIFVQGRVRALARKVKTATDNGVTIWSPEQLSEFLAKIPG